MSLKVDQAAALLRGRQFNHWCQSKRPRQDTLPQSRAASLADQLVSRKNKFIANCFDNGLIIQVTFEANVLVQASVM